MSLKGLSSDVEIAIINMIDVLAMHLEIDLIDDDKMAKAMDSKVSGFKFTKETLSRWITSPNAPSNEKAISYAKKLVETGDENIMLLRDALRSEIKVQNLKPEQLQAALRSKAMILQFIHTLDKELADLRQQLQDNLLQLEDREFEVGYPERFARGDFFPKQNYWKKWHNEEEDAIIICPKGTKGEIIEIDTDGSGTILRVQLPKQPPKNQMMNHGLPKPEQYWKRKPEPDGLNPDSESRFHEHIMEQYRLRREGMWFLNNGNPVYLTGNAWFALQHCKMEDNNDYMDFRYAQLEMFYVAEAVLRDPRCIGELFVKSRRTGFTYVTLFIMLNDATSNKVGNFGMTSQNDDDAKKAFNKFAYAFRQLPFYFKPVVVGTEQSEVKLRFGMPPDRSKKAKLLRNNKEKEYLNVLVDYQPTKNSSYDGQKLTMYLGDEAGKWKKPANYENHWGRISPTFDEGGQIVGKAFIGSTVNPMKEGGAEFKKLFYQSKVNKRDEITARTPSALYGYFLPAHKNMTAFTDKYGVCWTETPPKGTLNVSGKPIKRGSVAFLEARRKAKRRESDIAYNEELRAFPMTVEEALRDSAKKNVLPIEKINEQIAHNDSLNIHTVVSRGNFAWDKGIPDSKVVWVPNPEGRFMVSWFPKPHQQNNFKSYGGMREPLNGHIGCFGCDPFDISGTVSDKGSRGALHGVTGFSMEDVPSNICFLEYINRTSTAEQFFEDVLMACVFYGMPILIENNKPRILYHFKNRGYRKFCLNRPDKAINMLSKSERELGGIPSASKDNLITHASFLENFIRNFVGVYTEADVSDDEQPIREFGTMGSFPFQETLSDLLTFDIANREKSDASISLGYALMGLNRALLTPTPQVTRINMGLRTYDNKGSRSKLVSEND